MKRNSMASCWLALSAEKLVVLGELWSAAHCPNNVFIQRDRAWAQISLFCSGDAAEHHCDVLEGTLVEEGGQTPTRLLKMQTGREDPDMTQRVDRHCDHWAHSSSTFYRGSHWEHDSAEMLKDVLYIQQESTLKYTSVKGNKKKHLVMTLRL